MNYELAQQLKKAGFPQKECADKFFIKDWVYRPDLRELIEACNIEDQFRLECWHKVDWEASKNIIELKANGKTPEEAVAKLWLELQINEKMK